MIREDFIRVPGGKYRHLEKAFPTNWSTDEAFKEVSVEVGISTIDFGKFPITNRQYREFIDWIAAGHPCTQSFIQRVIEERERRARQFVLYAGSTPSEWVERFRSRFDSHQMFKADDQPVVGVCWFSAIAYCIWRSMREGKTFRLPTNEEWEWAAGGGIREFPWGNESPDCSRANYGRKIGHTTPVDAYYAGATPNGIMDMAGNVYEWTDSTCGYTHYVKGGSWQQYSVDFIMRCRYRNPIAPTFVHSPNVGFRVVREVGK